MPPHRAAGRVHATNGSALPEGRKASQRPELARKNPRQALLELLWREPVPLRTLDLDSEGGADAAHQRGFPQALACHQPLDEASAVGIPGAGGVSHPARRDGNDV